MGFAQHLSVRIPWHDTDFSGRVCADPAANTSCVMLTSIGSSRDTRAEVAQAGMPWQEDVLPPCVKERGGFMSGRDRWFTRPHPYSRYPALRALRPAVVHLPKFAVHAIPYLLAAP